MSPSWVWSNVFEASRQFWVKPSVCVGFCLAPGHVVDCLSRYKMNFVKRHFGRKNMFVKPLAAPCPWPHVLAEWSPPHLGGLLRLNCEYFAVLSLWSAPELPAWLSWLSRWRFTSALCRSSSSPNYPRDGFSHGLSPDGELRAGCIHNVSECCLSKQRRFTASDKRPARHFVSGRLFLKDFFLCSRDGAFQIIALLLLQTYFTEVCKYSSVQKSTTLEKIYFKPCLDIFKS